MFKFNIYRRGCCLMFNKDFYPTPESLIAKMFMKIEKDQT